MIWTLVVGLGSFYSGGPLMKVAEAIGENPWIAPVILVVFGGALWLYLEGATKKKMKV